jgi:hypothetical protein
MSSNSKCFYDAIIPVSYENTTTKMIPPSDEQCQATQFKNDYRISLNKNFTRVLHLSYSQDMALSDFHVFGAIEQRLCVCQGRSFEELQVNVQQIWDAIQREKILATLCERKARFHRSVATDREYVESAI